MKSKNLKLGVIGETAISLELMKKGYDVINLNNIYQNYKKADLICINPDTGKSVMIQVKTGTTTNIMCGFTSELDGTVPELEEKVIGPWVLTKEETIELIKTSCDWYANAWNRKLTSKPMVGVEVKWLEGNPSEASKPNAKKQHTEYISTLRQTSQNRWDKIEDQIV